MLGGALKEKAAKAQPLSSSAAGTKKNLFGPPSTPQPSRDIRSQLGGGWTTAAMTATAREERGASTIKSTASKPTHNPLHSISGNRFGQVGSNSLMSLFGNSQDDPFAEDTNSAPQTSQQHKPIRAVTATAVPPGVELFEDDFDDSFFDMPYEEPVALAVKQPAITTKTAPPPPSPLLQKAAATTPQPKEVISLDSDPVRNWWSSPESHYAPPSGRTQLLQDSNSLKRESSGELPTAKRRTLPPSFAQARRNYSQQSEAVAVVEETAFATTPAKPKDSYAYELTASVIQERKKQHKLKTAAQNREEVEDEAQVNERVAQITSSNTAKHFAISLSAEQKHVLDLVVNQGKSVFFTGPAGTGKSVLMRAIIEELRKKYHTEPDRVAVTASTGFAACNIGGITLHSFAGIGLGKEDAAVLVKKVRRNQVAKQRWLKTKCLIIDEVSMVDGDLFDKLSQIGRQVRGNGRPWGGLQLIITGDFFQLPPVPEGGRETKFAFDASTWRMSINHTIGLTQIFRQRDPTFANMLNEMRLGRIDNDTIDAFKRLERPLPTDDGIEATELFPTRHEVETANTKRLMALEGEPHMFGAIDSGRADLRDRLLQNMMAPKQLVLKAGAQVMLIKNLDDNLVNGTQGTVLGFFAPDETEKATGSDDESAKKTRKKIRQFTNTDASKKIRYPLVEFRLANGNKQEILCEPHDWKVELPNGEIQASRMQVPLILAWALSIHKAQGQTLVRVRVNLHRVFEKGQAYVALSRATSQEGLQVLGFQPSKVMAHPRVVEFYQRLYSVDQIVAENISTTALTSKRETITASASVSATKAPARAPTRNAAGGGNSIQRMLATQNQTVSAAGRFGAREKKKTPAHAL